LTKPITRKVTDTLREEKSKRKDIREKNKEKLQKKQSEM